MPAWTWDDLEEELTRLAASPAQRAMVEPLVSAVAKRTAVLSAGATLREILCLATVIADETFEATLSEEPIETI